MTPVTKYAVVTGCSRSSIGFLAAKALAAPPHNYEVILACRDPEKGHQAQEMISKSSGATQTTQTTNQTHYLPLDLASKESIQDFCQQLLRSMDDGAITRQGLNLLVNNAGVGWGQQTPFIQTKDGLEEIVGVNHFGTFYLTYLLLDDLKRASQAAAANKNEDAPAHPQARAVVVSSSLHDPNSCKKKFSDHNDDNANELLLPDFPNGILQTQDQTTDYYDGAKAYWVSKLCNLWFSYELQ
jgi:NAD(P)-dependent dehydrogenase (short-subunit alcohol dehydrogenase family)